MQADSSNIIAGCKVKVCGEEYTVIKVNAKSLYISKLSWSEYCSEWERRFKGTTFKEFCKSHSISMISYTGVEVEESEVKKKEGIENSNYKLDGEYSLALGDYIKELSKKKRRYMLHTIECNKGFIRILEEREGCFLLNINKDYVLHCMETGESCKIGSVTDYNYDGVPWEKLSKFSCITA